MIDITGYANSDLTVLQADTPKAANVLSVQLGALEYQKTFGVDLKFFLNPDFQFQNESFRAYLIQRLSESHVPVASVMTELQRFYLKFTFEVGDESVPGGGFIA